MLRVSGVSDQELPPSTSSAHFTSIREELAKASGDKTGISIDPEDLLGYTFANEKDGLTQKAKIIAVDKDTYQVIIEYGLGQQDLLEHNELINIINTHEEDGDGIWTFKGIKDHRKKGRK